MSRSERGGADLSAAKTNKKRRTQEDANTKRLVLPTGSSGSTSAKPMLFENMLSLPIQQALFKFREASELELIRLRKEGLEPSVAINKLVEKMRTIGTDHSACFSRQELDLVMEMAGINEEGAIRALLLRSELAKLRHDGFNHPEAIGELVRRMKRLAGSKRRVSLSVGDGLEAKHRRTTGTALPPPPPPPLGLARMASFASPLDPPLSATTRKRLQDVLMMDTERWGERLRKRARFLERVAEGEEIGSGDDGLPPPPDDLGEFSQGEEGADDGGEGEDLFGGSLDFSAFTSDYPSSDEGDLEGEGSIPSSTDPLLDTFPSDPEDLFSPSLTLASTFLSPPPPSSSSSSSIPPPPRSLRLPSTTKHRDPHPSSFSHRTIS